MAECPREALADHTLPPMARILLTVLWSYAWKGRRFVWPSPATLATQCGMSERSVRRNLKTLREREWITAAEDVAGRPGWNLCDPPGDAVHTGHEAPAGAPHPDASVIDADASDREPDASVPEPDEPRTLVSPKPDASDRPYLTRKLVSKQTTNHFSPEVQGAETTAPSSSSDSPPAPDPEHPSAHAWSMEWAIRWRQELGYEVTGYRLHDPTRGPRKVVALQQALDEYGRTLVESVLLHAGRRVVRHHESKGRHGLHPKMFGALFYEDRPRAWEACLDAWQADEGRRRVSGRVSAPPGDLDGQPLTDDEQRAWMVAGGGQDAEQAIRDMREAADAASSLARWGGAVLGLGEGAA